MKNKILSNLIKFLLIFILCSSSAMAHKSKKHVPGTKFDPVVCIPPAERTTQQKTSDSLANNLFHRLSKLQQDCAIYKIQQLELGISEIEKENKEMEEALANAALCGDIYFNHKSKKSTKIYKKPDLKSGDIANVKLGADLLYVSDSSKNKNWAFVLLRDGKKCSSGYIEGKFIAKKDEIIKKAPVTIKADLISITKPKWDKKEKLILVPASGFVTIKGFVDSDKIDQIIVNEKERQINNDDTFTFNIRVKDAGSEVRIVGNKKGETKKTITFLIKVK
tara:strand:- start:2468 stop:3301 length:834 start_codon:yes stop_codon:yes gene_type:complete